MLNGMKCAHRAPCDGEHEDAPTAVNFFREVVAREGADNREQEASAEVRSSPCGSNDRQNFEYALRANLHEPSSPWLWTDCSSAPHMLRITIRRES